MTSASNRCVGITLGDPSGIGPEIIARALTKPSIRKLGHFKLIGDYSIYQRYSTTHYKNCTFIDLKKIRSSQCRPGKPNNHTANASLSALHTAVKMFKRKEINALVTAPVCKEAIGRIQPSFQGHTEFLADTFYKKNVGMMFVARQLRTIIVTRHIPLQNVSAQISSSNIYETIALAHQSLKNTFKIKKPVIAVCGLNPHAGEGGTIGTEEIQKIIPAIKRARRNQMDIRGPFPADTLFSPDISRQFDIIIAMYHDQGLIPIKTLYFKNLVNLTVGLPLIRTSPAHGTAFDIAAKHVADPSSMCAAIKLATELTP